MILKIGYFHCIFIFIKIYINYKLKIFICQILMNIYFVVFYVNIRLKISIILLVFDLRFLVFPYFYATYR